MNVAVFSGSPRKDGSNTDIVIKKVLEGMGVPDHEIIKINELNIRGCQGCGGCRKEGAETCVQDDDMQQLYAKIIEADVIVLGSPIYYGYLTGQAKCFIDRWYAFRDCNRELRFDEGKQCIFVLVQGAPGRERYKEVITDMRHIFTKYGIGLKVVVADGVEEKCSVLNKEDLLEEAYYRGRELRKSFMKIESLDT